VETGKQVLSILIQLTRDTGKTMIMATHSADVISLADDVYNIRNGQLIAVGGKKKSLSAGS
jgi:putative ABC transport system ATP-binding protein